MLLAECFLHIYILKKLNFLSSKLIFSLTNKALNSEDFVRTKSSEEALGGEASCP